MAKLIEPGYQMNVLFVLVNCEPEIKTQDHKLNAKVPGSTLFARHFLELKYYFHKNTTIFNRASRDYRRPAKLENVRKYERNL